MEGSIFVAALQQDKFCQSVTK